MGRLGARRRFDGAVGQSRAAVADERGRFARLFDAAAFAGGGRAVGRDGRERRFGRVCDCAGAGGHRFGGGRALVGAG